jgi:hypothetical protein
MTTQARNTWAMLRFHLKVGARAALRNLAPAAGAFLFIYFILRPEFSAFFMRLLLFENGILVSGLTLALAGLIAAKVASARVLGGAAGWVRHLPLGSATHRRLAVVGVTVACAPVLIILGYLVSQAAWSGIAPTLDPVSHKLVIVPRPHFWLLAGLPFLAAAASLYWTPVRHRLTSRVLAFLACLGFGGGFALPFAAGAALLIAADRAAGPLKRSPRNLLFVLKGRNPALPYLISMRAVGARFIPLYLMSFVVLILSRLFVLNNRVDGALESAAIRFGGTASLVVFLSLLASFLAARRPPWPWIRSLPSSARERIVTDAVFLAIPSLSLVAVTAALSPTAAPAILAALPWLSIRAAAHMRRSPDLRSGPSLAILLEGLFAAIALSLAWWSCLALLAASLPALTWASRLEQRVKVSRWTELHHLTTGDPQSWSSS